MKLRNPFKNKFSVGLLINLVLSLVILVEAYLVYSLLYKNLNPQPNEIVLTKIVKVDLKAYEATAVLLQSYENYVPDLSNLKNFNPFKYK